MMRYTLLAVVVSLAFTLSLRGQQIPIVAQQQSVGGVYIDTDGVVHHRQADTAGDLAAARLRAKALNQPPKSQPITYVSLNRLLAQVQSLSDQKKEIPDELRYLSGLTQLRYVFVFADDKDLVIAGPSEPFDAINKLQPHGKTTGRPVMQLDDLVTALRISAGNNRRQQAFGCSIDPHPDSLARSTKVMQDFASASRGERMNAMKEALGGQRVSMFGAPNDTRFAFVTLAADYRLKRLCLAVDPMPVAGVGSPFDNSRAATARFWFEANYAPLLVSPAGDAYEIRGPRLMLKAGTLQFDPKDATEAAKSFAKKFTDKIPQLATMVPAFADLQNVADLALLANLIRQDKLDQKSGLDLSWVLAEKNYKVANLPTPKQAETIVNFTSGSIVAGGVTLNLASVVAESNREQDKTETLKGSKLRPSSDNWSHTKEK